MSDLNRTRDKNHCYITEVDGSICVSYFMQFICLGSLGIQIYETENYTEMDFLFFYCFSLTPYISLATKLENSLWDVPL